MKNSILYFSAINWALLLIGMLILSFVEQGDLKLIIHYVFISIIQYVICIFGAVFLKNKWLYLKGLLGVFIANIITALVYGAVTSI
jgi:hypothetical protein